MVLHKRLIRGYKDTGVKSMPPASRLVLYSLNVITQNFPGGKSRKQTNKQTNPAFGYFNCSLVHSEHEFIFQ